jgi:opacity protein-like surface antigen
MFRVKLVFAFTLVFSTVASGQVSYPTEHREWEASAFAGGSIVSDSEFSTRVLGGPQETAQTVGMEYGDGYQIGLRLAEHLHDFWGADLEYTFANQPLRFTNLAPDIQSLSLSHSLHHFSYNVSFLPIDPARRFRPYGKLGAGAALFFINGSSKDEAELLGLNLRDSWEFMMNWGGGFKFLVMDQFAVVADVKDQISGIPSYGLPTSARIVNGQYQPGIRLDGFLHNWQFNLGLAVQWDDYW